MICPLPIRSTSCPPAPPRRSLLCPDWYNDDTGKGSPAYGLTKQYTCVKCQPQVRQESL